MQKELTQRHNLLGQNGQILEQGYAKSLILRYERSQFKKNKILLKEWDYYIITDGEKAVAFTIADNGYMGLFSASYLNFKDKKQVTKTKMSAFPMGKINLPMTSEHGVSEISKKNFSLRFEKVLGTRKITCRWENFCDDEPLVADITLSDFPKDSMVIATDFINSSAAFYYNQKINCQRATGKFSIGEKEFTFDPSVSLGTLDWGRGVWSYENTWYWGSLSARLKDGRTIGFNLGTGFASNAYATEDMLFVDGIATKLDKVRWEIPKDAEGEELFMHEWTFASDCGKLKLVFRPILDREAMMNVLILKTEQHQVFGYFSGTVATDAGEMIEIEDLLGFAEKVFNRY